MVRTPFTLSALALTGGGVLGLFTGRMLERLAELRREAVGVSDPTKAHLREAFDLIAGTSIGALIAGGLVVGHAPEELCTLIKDNAARIFPNKSSINRLLHLRSAWFRSKPLQDVVLSVIDRDVCLGDLEHHIAIPALRESTGEPIVFTTLNAAHAGVSLADAVLASAAAPIYFPARQIDRDRYVDGGLFANAPDLTAVNLLRRKWPQVPINRISVVSIGTTSASAESPVPHSETGDWGLWRWFASPSARLVKLALRAQSDHTINAMSLLQLDAFHRIDEHLTFKEGTRLDMDNARADALACLNDVAERRLQRLTRTEADALRQIVSRWRWRDPA